MDLANPLRRSRSRCLSRRLLLLLPNPAYSSWVTARALDELNLVARVQIEVGVGLVHLFEFVLPHFVVRARVLAGLDAVLAEPILLRLDHDFELLVGDVDARVVKRSIAPVAEHLVLVFDAA